MTKLEDLTVRIDLATLWKRCHHNPTIPTVPVANISACFGQFRFNRNMETCCFDEEAKKPGKNILFRIVPKLVSVPVSAVSYQN